LKYEVPPRCISDNLKSIFFRELSVVPAETDLHCGTETDAEVVTPVISRVLTRWCLRIFGPLVALSGFTRWENLVVVAQKPVKHPF
jgi:hypothetical protein